MICTLIECLYISHYLSLDRVVMNLIRLCSSSKSFVTTRCAVGDVSDSRDLDVTWTFSRHVWTPDNTFHSTLLISNSAHTSSLLSSKRWLRTGLILMREEILPSLLCHRVCCHNFGLMNLTPFSAQTCLTSALRRGLLFIFLAKVCVLSRTSLTVVSSLNAPVTFIFIPSPTIKFMVWFKQKSCFIPSWALNAATAFEALSCMMYCVMPGGSFNFCIILSMASRMFLPVCRVGKCFSNGTRRIHSFFSVRNVRVSEQKESLLLDVQQSVE